MRQAWIAFAVLAAAVLMTGFAPRLLGTAGTQQQEIGQGPTAERVDLLLSLRDWPSRGLDRRRPRVVVAAWSSGLVVWDESVLGEPRYVCARLSTEESDRVKAALTDLKLVQMEPFNHMPPDSSCAEIRLVHPKAGIREYSWDQRLWRGPDGRSGLAEVAEAWTEASGIIHLIRPARGEPLASDLKALGIFTASFPGFAPAEKR